MSDPRLDSLRDIAMASVEVLTLAYIGWKAFAWKHPKDAGGESRQGLDLRLDPRTSLAGVSWSLRF